MIVALLATVALLAGETTGQGPQVSVPYIDVTLKNAPKLVEVANKTGQKFFTLAFVLGSHSGCDPKWAGELDLDDERIISQVRELQLMGGGVMVASGGAIGPYLETACVTVDQLTDAYLKILDVVGTSHLDIDIEASIDVNKMNKALAEVQRQRPETTVSFTLMVQGDDYGLTPQLGVDLLKNAVANQVKVDIVNAMAMEFGSSHRRWGDAVIAAAESVLGQMKTIWPKLADDQLKSMLGVTPMIGRNFNGRVFSQEDARQLVAWASEQNVGMLAFWSVGRDFGCPGQGQGVSPVCSGMRQTDFEFTRIFQRYSDDY